MDDQEAAQVAGDAFPDGDEAEAQADEAYDEEAPEGMTPRDDDDQEAGFSHDGGEQEGEEEEGYEEGEGEGDQEFDDEGQEEDDAFDEENELAFDRAAHGDLGLLTTPHDAGYDGYDDAPLADRLDLLAGRSGDGSQGSRPQSALVDLRGSRPNSAAIAQEIEGFEDDFMERVDEEEEEGEMYEEQAMMEEEEELGPSIEELLERATMEQLRLQADNEMLQKKTRLALDFRNKGRPLVNRDNSRLDGLNVRYKSSLKQWMEILEERDRVENHYQSTIFDMKSNLEERIKRADDIARAYKHFRLEVAKSAEHSKTGRPISDRLLAHTEQEDQEKEEEVQRVRLKNIHLTNQLKRIEQTLRQKEELAEGLHLIDFEQLKIENQSLNEKIEERNEELLKLRKKTTTTVQILTHIREKLQFVEKENASLATQLEELDSKLSEERDKLGKAKSIRDTMRHKGRKIKETSVFVTNPTLLNDIGTLKDKKEQVLFVIEDLKQEHQLLSEVISKANTKINTMTEDLAAAGAPNVMNILRSIGSQKSKVGSISTRSRADSIKSGRS